MGKQRVAAAVGVLIAFMGWAAVAGAETVSPQTRVSSTSNTGADEADFSAIAYNPLQDQYLVVYDADPGTVAGLVDEEHEIFGQLVDGDGSLVGPNFRISDAGPDANDDFDAVQPSVAYNARTNEYSSSGRETTTSAHWSTASSRSSVSASPPPAPSSAPTTSGSPTWGRTATPTGLRRLQVPTSSGTR